MRALFLLLFVSACGLRATDPTPPPAPRPERPVHLADREYACPPGMTEDSLTTAAGEKFSRCVSAASAAP